MLFEHSEMLEDSKKKKKSPRGYLVAETMRMQCLTSQRQSAPSLSSPCSQGVLPLQLLTAARVRRLFPYLGPGGQANAAATGPFSFLITVAETTCLCSGCEQHSRAGDHKRRSAGLLLLFINSFFSLEVELTFFDLINYKLI